MNILSLENITKSYTGRLLFDDTSFFLHENEKVGIIGINGTGKSTLLKIVAGLDEADEGKYTLANNMVIKYLPQHPVFDSNTSVIDSVLKDDEHISESDAKSMMTRLGITDFSEKVGVLSGGQRKRLALVSALLAPSDILILDEPTNHLDSEMSTWLEEQLRNYKGAVIMVTHDRYFLDLVCNRIVELDKGKLYSYDENYSGYLVRKKEREDSLEAHERKRKSILRKEIEWMQRGARARSTKQKAHIQRYEELAAMKGPEYDGAVQMSSAVSRLGKTTVELENISKSYGEKVLIKDFSYIFLKDDRVGFVGKNGCGKTTLMKMIVGEEAPDFGKITIGQTVKIGYYSQEIANDKSLGKAYMNPDMKVIDYIREIAEFVTTSDGKISASTMLDRFLFTNELKYSLIGKLSGGEKRRLNLLRVLMEAPNVIILDEPTNDLDIATLQILEDYLDDFQGIVITVSHDRYFLDRIVKRIFSIEENGKLVQSEGGYTDYENRKLQKDKIANAKSANAKSANAKSANAKSVNDKTANATLDSSFEKVSKAVNNSQKPVQKLKFSYNEMREYETIDDDIATLEDKLMKIDEEIAANSSNSFKLVELTSKRQETEKLLEDKMNRWVYLNELAEKIEAQNSAK